MNVGDEFGPYTIESVLGRGGMGTVYLATSRAARARVALKVISPDLADDPDFRARFLRESRLAASLDHPHVIPIYDADEVEGVLYLAMRYVDGPSLQRGDPRERAPLLRGRRRCGSPSRSAARSTLRTRRRWSTATSSPRTSCSPRPAGTPTSATSVWRKRTSSRGMTHAGSFLGTVDYCSPEQIRGEPLDGRADLYSLGCVIYHCLSGEPPYARESEVAVLQAHLNEPPPSLAPDLDGVFARAMAKEREERYPTAGALTCDLRDAIAGGAAETVPFPGAPGPWRRDQTPRRGDGAGHGSSRSLVLLAVVAAAAATLGDARLELRRQRDRPRSVRRPDRERAQTVRLGPPGDRPASAPAGCKVPMRTWRVESEASPRIARASSSSSGAYRPHRRHRPDGDPASAEPPELDRGRPPLPRWVLDEHQCPIPTNPSFILAAASDRRATTAKALFVAQFDPLATSLHRKSGPRDSSDLARRRRLGASSATSSRRASSSVTSGCGMPGSSFRSSCPT